MHRKMKQRLIDANALHYRMGVNQDDKQIFYVMGEDIDAAPTIDPESLRPMSQFVQDTYGVIKCKNCGYCVAIGGKNALHNAKREFRFCYNCGAKLEGQSDGATD